MACVNWLKLIEKQHCKITVTHPEEELVCSQSNKFVNAIDGKHVLTSGCGSFLLQGQRDLLGVLGRPVAPVVPTIALYAKFSGVIESVASYTDTGQWFSVPTGKVGLTLSTEKRLKLMK